MGSAYSTASLQFTFKLQLYRQQHFRKQKIYLARIFPLIQPLLPLRKDYFHQNKIDLHVEIIHCIQAIWRHWSGEPIITLSRPSKFMSRFIRTDYHAGQILIPHRPSRHRRFLMVGTPPTTTTICQRTADATLVSLILQLCIYNGPT